MIKAVARVIRETRQARGLRPRDLARDADMPEARLTALENGQDGATTADLARLATALELEFDALLRGQRVERPSVTVFLRHARDHQDFHPRDLPIIESAIEQGRALVRLRTALAEPPGLFQRSVFKARAAPNKDPARAGYVCAREVRRLLERPVHHLTDLTVLLEDQFGVAVVVAMLHTSNATAFGIKAGAAAAVIVNATPSRRAAMRNYLAHELGHILCDPATGGINLAVDVDRRDRHAAAAEKRAGGFAAELLLPIAGLRDLLGAPIAVSGHDDAIRVTTAARDHFGTTWPMTANHLCNLGFIHSELRQWLEAIEGPPVAPAYLDRQRTALPATGAPSLAVAALTRMAYDRGLLIDAEARALLGLDEAASLPWDD